MTIVTVLSFLFGSLIAVVGCVYCFKPTMIVRQINETGQPRLLHFALPIGRRHGVLTARQVRGTGLGLLLLAAWFLLVAITSM
ncbi:MAG TPA: hypothetical protein VIU85_05505 [Chthoniobacterales bacterium]